MDLMGSILGGSRTAVASKARDFAAAVWPGSEATVVMAKEKSGCVGAVFANAFQANAIDIDDGYRLVKGHPGALVIPAALATAEYVGGSGRRLIEAIVAGYEVGTRAGLIWHRHYPLYHASGSWGTIAAASAAAVMLDLKEEQTFHALGIAEYQAPVNPMMRCIDYPAMVKDGIGWGSPTGVTAALMAERGFTGIPSLFGFSEYAPQVESLGKTYNILDLYFKPYACCRWAQPPMAAALQLMDSYKLSPLDIERITVLTFRESARLGKAFPCNTEEAQYSICYPLAAAIVDGAVGPDQVLDEKLKNPAILDMLARIEIKHDPRFDEKFPAVAEAEVEITTKDGRNFSSGTVQAKGDPDNPLNEEELKEKFNWLAGKVKKREEIDEIKQCLNNLEDMENIGPLMRLLQMPSA